MISYLFVYRYPEWVPVGRASLPTGMVYIATVLKEKCKSVYGIILNMHSNEEKALRDVIIDKKIDVLCMGGLSPDLSYMKTIIKEARMIKPQIKVIVGGGAISSEPEISMKILKADIGVIGEGENTICEIDDVLSGKNEIDSVDGIIYLNQNELVKTKDRTDLVDIDSLPFPDWDIFSIDQIPVKQRMASLVPIVASRSCPFRCTFCYHPCGNAYRARKIDNITAEMLYIIKKYGYKEFNIQDELFAANKVRLKDFCDSFSALNKKYNAVFRAQMRADFVDRESLQMLKDAGCILMGIGMESMDDKVLKSMNKKLTREQIANAYDLAYDVGLSVLGNLIFGDVAETYETAMNSISYYLTHRHYNINIVNQIGTYPGSAIYDYAVEKGIIKDKEEYLINGNFQIKLTQIDDEEHRKIMRLIEYTIRNNTGGIAFLEVNHMYDEETADLLIKCDKCMNDDIVSRVNLNHLSVIYTSCSKCLRIQRVDRKLLHFETIKLTTLTDNSDISCKISLICRTCGQSIFDGDTILNKFAYYYLCDSCKTVHRTTNEQIHNMVDLLNLFKTLKRAENKIVLWGNPGKIEEIANISNDLNDIVFKIVDSGYINYNTYRFNGISIDNPDTLCDTDYDSIVILSTNHKSEITDIIRNIYLLDKPIYVYPY